MQCEMRSASSSRYELISGLVANFGLRDGLSEDER
jgi:hypothetical protein